MYRSPIRFRCLTRCFDPNPGVLINDNDYKTWQGGLHCYTRCALVFGTSDPRRLHSTGLQAPCPQSTILSFADQIQQSDLAFYDIFHPLPSPFSCPWICILYVLVTVIDSPPTHFLIPTHALSSHPRLFVPLSLLHPPCNIHKPLCIFCNHWWGHQIGDKTSDWTPKSVPVMIG